MTDEERTKLEDEIVQAIIDRAKQGDLEAVEWLEQRGFIKELRGDAAARLDLETLMALIDGAKAGVAAARLSLEDFEFIEKLKDNVGPQSDEKVREAMGEIYSHLEGGDRDKLKSALKNLARLAEDGNQAAVSTYDQLIDSFDEQVRKQGIGEKYGKSRRG